MDDRDGCPDCGSEDHHGCDWPVRARAIFATQVRASLLSWFAQDPGDDYLDAMTEHVVSAIRGERGAAHSGRSTD